MDTDRPTGHRWRRVVAAVAVLTALPSAALADDGLEREVVAAINRERAGAGLSELSVADDLAAVARHHSRRMADRSDLHHNPGLGSDVDGWRKVGEVVGRGPSVNSIHTAFMNSTSHERSILDPDWTEVGAGVVVADDGQVWVTVVFRLPAAAPSPEPESEPEPRPAPEPEPEPEEDAATAPSASPDAEGPTPAADPAPAPKDEPHEVVEQPLPMDRMTLTLARLEAADGDHSLEELLTAG